jgi:hypothetical protein
MYYLSIAFALVCSLLVPSAQAATDSNFTKVCMSGELAGTGSCPASPVVGHEPNNWACTRDNTSLLVWSIESFANKTWAQATDHTSGSLVAGYNGSARCGFHANWRVPTRDELGSIVPQGDGSRAVDMRYFPEAVYDWHWSSDTVPAYPGRAWIGFFYNGLTLPRDKDRPMSMHVRLVRSEL